MPIDHVNALPPGTRFEEYRLDAVLGAGGFGITYRAYDANLDKFVAIKEYLPVEFATRTEASTVVPHSNADAQDYHWGLTRFLDEARTLARFDHPHLNKVYRFFESNGTAYMVLEYIQGETLADRLARQRQLPEEALQRLLEEVLSGLAVMHEAGYVHRDIKPGNLMLREEDGSAVVLDFGAARQAVGQRSKAITSILTPGYAPIEQYDSQADDVGPWSDVYALGMVAYRCISGIGDGELPDAVTRGRTQRKGQVGLTSATEAGKGQYNAKLLEAIDWAIEVDEEDRPQTVGEWLRALAGSGRRKSPIKAAGKTTAKPTGGAATRRSDPSWSSVALTLVLVVLLGIGAWWGWQEYPELFSQGGAKTSAATEPAEPGKAPVKPPQETEAQQTDAAAAGAEQTPPPDKEDAEVARLLAAAEVDLKARRLTSPAGNNAWEKYRHVLSLAPAHPEAMLGMERVIESYRQLFSAEVEKEDFDKAAGYLAKIGEPHPDSPLLDEGEQRLQDARQARVDRLAEQERKRQAAEEKMRQLAGEMVSIPGGTFRMGDLSGDGWDNEKPVHSVTVPAFRMGKYEVTFNQWDACVADGGCGGYTPDDGGGGRDSRPVINVSWDDVQGFIDWLNDKTGGNFRLPTEAEWEYAARAGSSTKYHFGNSESQLCRYDNHADTSIDWSWRNETCSDGMGERTAAVGRYQPNSYGLYDIHGNVGEWVEDCWNDSYSGAPNDGRAWMGGDCGPRVTRGGWWGSNPRYLRSAKRDGAHRSNRVGGLGFRLAQDK